jgi:fatty-acyl-CoA synthase
MGVFQGGPEVNERIVVRTSADIAAIERGGLDAFLPSATPFGLIESAASDRPDHCALHYLADPDDSRKDVQISYGMLVHKIRQAANLFRRLGVGAEDSVAILMPDVPASQIALIATRRAIEAALCGAKLSPGEFEIAASEAEIIVHVGNAECQETARRALVGMPIPYEVRLDSRVLPEILQ